MDKLSVELSEGDYAAWLTEPALSGERSSHLGDALRIQNLVTDLSGWIGESPSLLDVQSTMEKLKATDDEWQKVASDKVSNTFIETTFGIDKVGGLLEPDAIGLELLYRDDKTKLNRRQRIHVHSVFPSARFLVTRTSESSVELKGKAEFAAEISAPGVLVPLESASFGDDSILPIDGSAEIRASFTHDERMAISSNTYSPVVEAFGEGDLRAVWVFHRAHGPLVGKTLKTVTGLALGKGRSSLKFKARMFIIFKVGPYPIRRYSEYIPLKVDLH